MGDLPLFPKEKTSWLMPAKKEFHRHKPTPKQKLVGKNHTVNLSAKMRLVSLIIQP